MAIPTDDPDRPPRLALLLRRAWYQLNQAFRRRIAEHGVTPDQFTVMRWLREHPDGVTQRELAGLMASDANTIAALLARMERARLVDRPIHARDRRCRLIRLTVRGRRLHALIQPEATALQTRMLEALPSERREAFLADLERVAGACAEAAEPPQGPQRRSGRA